MQRYFFHSMCFSVRVPAANIILPYSDQYVQTLEDRLEKIESLLKSAGILNEADLHDNLSDDEGELPDEDWGFAHQRTESFAHSSDDSYASQSSPGCETALFPGGGDLEAAPLFRQHERDDSRYFGVFPFRLRFG